MFSTWSISTGIGLALASGIVSPARKPFPARPGVICTYFSPSADRERTRIVESTGSGFTSVCSFRWIVA